MAMVFEEVRHQAAIAGRVTDGERAVAGASIAIVTAPAAFTDLLVLKKLQYGSGWDAALKRADRTVSATDGHFHFLDLPDGTYGLSVTLPGMGTRYGAAQASVKVARDGSGTIGLAVAEIALPPTIVKGAITSGTSAVSMAEVRLQGSGESVFSDGLGGYVLKGVEAGSRTVLVFANGYKPASQAVNANPGSAQVLNFSLTAA